MPEKYPEQEPPNVEVIEPASTVLTVPDGGFGWAVVASSFVINVFTVGLMGSFGIFQSGYASEPEFAGQSTLAIAFIGSTATAGFPLFAIAAGRISDVAGPQVACVAGGLLMILTLVAASFSTAVWHLYITQGLLVGIASSLCDVPSVGILSQWFDKKLGLATGIAVAGTGVGGLMFGPILELLLSKLGWRWALRVTGIVGGTCLCLCAIFLRIRAKPRASRAINLSKFKDLLFLRLYGMSVTFSFGYFSPFFFLPAFALQNGMSNEQAALLLGVMNGASGVGRIALGLAADRFGHVNVLAGCLVSSAISILVIWPFSTTFGLLLMFSIIFGLAVGGLVSLTPTVTAVLFGAEGEISTVIGMIFSGFLVGNLVGTPISGALIDRFTVYYANGTKSSNFFPAILYTGICFVVASLFVISIKYSVGKRRFFERV